jgi:hypothetical protein
MAKAQIRLDRDVESLLAKEIRVTRRTVVKEANFIIAEYFRRKAEASQEATDQILRLAGVVGQ